MPPYQPLNNTAAKNTRYCGRSCPRAGSNASFAATANATDATATAYRASERGNCMETGRRSGRILTHSSRDGNQPTVMTSSPTVLVSATVSLHSTPIRQRFSSIRHRYAA